MRTKTRKLMLKKIKFLKKWHWTKTKLKLRNENLREKLRILIFIKVKFNNIFKLIKDEKV